MRPRHYRLVALLVSTALALAACSVSLPVESTTPGGTEAPGPTNAPDPTNAPEPTQAPEPTNAPDPTSESGATEPTDGTEETSDNTIWWFLGLAVLAFLLLGMLIGRGRKDKAVVPVAGKEGFKDFTRNGYSEARWLLDGMTEDLAIWRGNALFEGKTAPGDAAGTAMADNWAQLDDRMGRATDQLYRAEAAAPDQNSAGTVRATIDALNNARGTVDATAEARFNTRGVADGDQFALAEAGERERLASTNLGEAHQALSDALLALSAIV